MFYLSHFLKLFITYPARTLAFSLLGFSTFALLFFKAPVVREIQRFTQGEAKNAYFHALVSGRENHARISRNLMNLPGVESVEIMPESLIKEQVKEIIGSMSVNIPEAVFKLDYAGLKIIFTEGLKLNSQILIRDYLERLVGGSQVTMSAVKQVSTEKKISFWKTILERHGFWIIWFGLLFVWLSVCAFFIHGLRRQAYLLEQFQRRKNVGAKMFISGQTVLMMIFIGICLMFADWDWMVLALIVLGYSPALATMRKYSWH